MNIQCANRYNKNTINRNSANYNTIKKKVESGKINFINAMKSVDIEEVYFNNFLSSNQTTLYEWIKYYYELSEKNKFDIDKYFRSPNEITTFNPAKNSKLRNLIFETSNELLSDFELSTMMKYKNRENPAFQLFILPKNDVSLVLLIDFYHLVFPTENYQIGIKNDSEELYRRIKNKVKNKCNLAEVVGEVQYASQR